MKFVIAPDKYKDSLTGFQFCDAVEEGLKKVFSDAEIIKKPLADGGDGTIPIVKHYLDAEEVKVQVNNPLFRPVKASYLYAKKSQTAYIEMAEASGLKLLEIKDRNCMYTSSFGTGELITQAITKGAKTIILGIGGSATNDGGIGMAAALGYRFLDTNNKEIKPIGANLSAICRIDDKQVNVGLEKVNIKVACDVTNPLYGKTGAAYVYGKQKGASERELQILDIGLQNYAEVVQNHFNCNVQNVKGAGAAGGMGAGTYVFLKGKLVSGIKLIKELASFDEAIQNADWIITGEGQLDSQTLLGKTIDGVLKSAQKINIPVAALCGSVDLSLEDQSKMGLSYVSAITQGVSTLQEAMENSYGNLKKTAYNFANVLKEC